MKITTALAGLTVASGIALTGATSALAVESDPGFRLAPLDQATIIDPDTVTPAIGGLLTADGTNVCAVNPQNIAFANGTYPCFAGFWSNLPGAVSPVNPPSLVPFDQATVVDPTTVTIVQGGLITADGSDLCTVNPGSIVFPDGRYPCYINFTQTYTTNPLPPYLTAPEPQIAQMPVGGVDTGAAVAGTNETRPATLTGVGILGTGALLGLLAHRRRSAQA